MSRVEKQLDRKESCSLSICGPIVATDTREILWIFVSILISFLKYWTMEWRIEKGGFVSSLLPVRKIEGVSMILFKFK